MTATSKPMNIIEQATKRLEELRRGGVEVPWEASKLSEEHFNEMVQAVSSGGQPAGHTTPTQASAAAPTVPTRRATPAASHRHQSRTIDIDLARLARNRLLVPDQIRSPLAAQFRHVKRPLLKNLDRKTGNDRQSLIMVTSAMPGEGKTFCAINLAMSIAMEVDTSVLLVDADVVRPAVFDRLGLTAGQGLLDLLIDDSLDMSDVMLRTNVPKLSLLAAGRPSGNSTELLASDAMDRWLADVAGRYPDRVVIFDAPPLLVTTESRVLASRVGQVVMVVDSTRTSTTKVAEAFAAIENCPNVMSLLNKCPDDEGAGTYGYGYGYGY